MDKKKRSTEKLRFIINQQTLRIIYADASQIYIVKKLRIEDLNTIWLKTTISVAWSETNALPFYTQMFKANSG